ncbi:2-oxo acid dehydrogenase subunit E2 [Flavobacteriales bacterium]|jgi:pyruvate dehydrogenase E2 component (dihydrolipoamide acetyltransferase)|nr:2-oxo acid dehydrogenase subunit E2 [Flavobacteriales bacterium]
MAEIVRMPKLSDTMTDGVVAAWHKKVGDKVESGDLLAEIETDKATMEFESFQDGVLLHIGVEAGAGAPVESVLAVLGEAGEDIKTILEEAAKEVEVAKPEEKAAPTAAAAKPASSPAPAAAPATSSKKVEVKTVSSNLSSANTGRLFISPLAQKLADERGINTRLVKGTGDGGRIVKRDIDNFMPGRGVVSGIEKFSEVAVSNMRGVIASKLSESKHTAPHFYLTVDVDMDNAMNARKALNERGPGKVSFNDMVIKAVAAALIAHPDANSSWLGDRIRYNEHVHIGVAMAIDDGLIVPVVKFADEKDIHSVSAEVKEFSKKSKENKLTPDDWSGNTFTISNLGMFGIEEFTAIINPPDACILAVGAIRQVPVVKNGQVVPGNKMKLTLSCDHRVVDGAVGAPFLKTIKNNLENPILIFA